MPNVLFEGLPVLNPNDFDFNRDPMPLYRVGYGDREAFVWANHTLSDAVDEFSEWVEKQGGDLPEDWGDAIGAKAMGMDAVGECRDACLAWRHRAPVFAKITVEEADRALFPGCTDDAIRGIKGIRLMGDEDLSLTLISSLSIDVWARALAKNTNPRWMKSRIAEDLLRRGVLDEAGFDRVMQ